MDGTNRGLRLFFIYHLKYKSLLTGNRSKESPALAVRDLKDYIYYYKLYL